MSELILSPDEIAARGETFYESGIRAGLSPSDDGKFVVIDVVSGAYEIDSEDMAAIRRAAQHHPNGIFHIIRVGSRTVGRVGGKFRPATG